MSQVPSMLVHQLQDFTGQEGGRKCLWNIGQVIVTAESQWEHEPETAISLMCHHLAVILLWSWVHKRMFSEIH